MAPVLSSRRPKRADAQRNFDALLTARLALGILDLSCEAG